MKPSIECVDPASNKYTCSCNCTNGVIISQPLTSFTQAGGSCCSSLDDCQAEMDKYVKAEQELKTQLNEERERHAKREEEFSAALITWKRTPFKYKGCWKDTSSRVLRGSGRIHDLSMTRQKCETHCQNSTHYAVQAGTECWCGNEIAEATEKLQESDCDYKCMGDQSQICGGSWKMSLFSKEMWVISWLKGVTMMPWGVNWTYVYRCCQIVFVFSK